MTGIFHTNDCILSNTEIFIMKYGILAKQVCTITLKVIRSALVNGNGKCLPFTITVDQSTISFGGTYHSSTRIFPFQRKHNKYPTVGVSTIAVAQNYKKKM